MLGVLTPIECAKVIPNPQTTEINVKRLIISTFLAGIAMTATAATASAQNPFEIGAAAGAAMPLSDLDDIADVGYNVAFFVGYKPAMLPIGLRFEAAYNAFGTDFDEDLEVVGFTANGIFSLPTGGFTPYVIGGAGLYRVDEFFVAPNDSRNKFGFNIGGGISMPLSGFKVFVEARFNSVSLDPNATFIPIVFGASF